MDYVTKLRSLVGHIPLQLPGSNVVVFRHNSDTDKIEVLTQLRSDHTKYGLLGGGIELGETYEICACRELLEESGLFCITDDLELLKVYAGPEFVTIHPNGDVVYHTIILYSLPYEKTTHNSNENFSDETLSIEWMDLDKIKELLNKAEQNFFHCHIPIFEDIVAGTFQLL